MQQMDALLLKKIEELALYSIQTEKRVKQLVAENAEIKYELSKFNAIRK
jgi:hypothetical protein